MKPTLIQDAEMLNIRNRNFAAGLYECPLCKLHFTARKIDIETARKRNCGCAHAYKEEQLPNELNGYKIVADLRSVKRRRSILLQCPKCPNTFPAVYIDVKRGRNRSDCGQHKVSTKVYEKKERILKDTSYRHTSEYFTWTNMKRRCNSPSHHKYKDYGARGINVCERWLLSFDNFLSDMGNRPTDTHTLDRINNDGNYEPLNCRWATQLEQQHNKRPRNHRFK